MRFGVRRSSVGTWLARAGAFGVAALASLPVQAASRHRVDAPHWHTVLRVQGTTTGNTPAFTVAGPWRLVWSARSVAGGGTLWVHAAGLGSTAPPRFLVNAAGTRHGASASEDQPGTYYLHIQADERYTVAVETRTSRVPTQPTDHWKTLTTVVGTGALSSSIFTVKSPWRIVWKSHAPGTISVDVTVPGMGATADRFAEAVATTQGVGYEYTAGTYYLVVTASAPYKLAIQQG